MAEQGIHSYIFFAQNFQPHRQRGKGRIDISAHKVGQRKRTVRAAQQQGDARVQVGDALTGNVVDGRDAAAVRRTVQRFVKQEGKQRTFVAFKSLVQLLQWTMATAAPSGVVTMSISG